MEKQTIPSCIKRHPGNPVLTAADVPYEATLVFNAGITKFNGTYVMVFRNDYGSPETEWHKAYHSGIMLLDLEDPSKIVGIYDKPILPPEKDDELKGFRGSVIFPGGMILEDSGEVKIYYGAADTVECLATADVNDLIALCLD